MLQDYNISNEMLFSLRERNDKIILPHLLQHHPLALVR
jgi:hypothetical protein